MREPGAGPGRRVDLEGGREGTWEQTRAPGSLPQPSAGRCQGPRVQRGRAWGQGAPAEWGCAVRWCCALGCGAMGEPQERRQMAQAVKKCEGWAVDKEERCHWLTAPQAVQEAWCWLLGRPQDTENHGGRRRGSGRLLRGLRPFLLSPHAARSESCGPSHCSGGERWGPAEFVLARMLAVCFS